MKKNILISVMIIIFLILGSIGLYKSFNKEVSKEPVTENKDNQTKPNDDKTNTSDEDNKENENKTDNQNNQSQPDNTNESELTYLYRISATNIDEQNTIHLYSYQITKDWNLTKAQIDITFEELQNYKKFSDNGDYYYDLADVTNELKDMEHTEVQNFDNSKRQEMKKVLENVTYDKDINVKAEVAMNSYYIVNYKLNKGYLSDPKYKIAELEIFMKSLLEEY